jgi:LuxR family transcriptional regulator, glucitol operon activator
MATTIQRVTLYACLATLESDLRGLIAQHLPPSIAAQNLVDSATLQRAIDRFVRDNSSSDENIATEDLLEYFDLGDTLHCLNRHIGTLPASIAQVLRNNTSKLEGLIAIRNRVMHIRPLEFDDYERVIDLCRMLTSANSFMWHELRDLLKKLKADPQFLNALTIPSSEQFGEKLHNLPSPDFDDTGFLGRQSEIDDLKKAIEGSYPVITVAGEGGVGKSALALKVCYDIVDDPHSRFDAVIWVTAKANKLTPYEIQAIDDAITDSIGLFETAANQLGRQNTNAPLDDLLLHLAHNKILLVVDNLETVVDQTIRDFVRQIPLGSKVVFTSRIGLGAFDFPLQLTAFATREANHYLRKTARVWGLTDVAKFPAAKIDEYCRRLQHNPLFIKWFIQGMRAGQTAESILAKPKLLLEFCLQNVFEHLDDDAKKIAYALLTIGGYQSQATLSFITDFRSDRLQRALTRLLSANIINAQRSESLGGDDLYAITPLALLYLANYHAPPAALQEQFVKQREKLRGVRDDLRTRPRNVYDMKHVVDLSPATSSRFE